MFKKLGLITLCAASAFAMHNVELNINDKDLEIGVKLDMGQFIETTKPDTVFIGGKFLHADKKHSNLSILEDIGDYGELNFLMKRDISDIGLSIGLGVKLNYTKDFSSFPLGAEIFYKIPIETVPMSIGGAVYYSPEVLTFQDGKSYFEYRVEFDAEVITNGHIVVGYRNMNTNYNIRPAGTSGDKNYNKSPYVGFKFSF